MTKKQKWITSLITVFGIAAAIRCFAKKKKEKEETDDRIEIYRTSKMDPEIEQAFDWEPATWKHLERIPYTKLKPSNACYIVLDRNGMVSDCYEKAFLFDGYRIYFRDMDQDNQEPFSVKRFLQEKSILFITYSENPEDSSEQKYAKKEKLSRMISDMEKEIKNIYTSATHNGIATTFHDSAIVSSV